MEAGNYTNFQAYDSEIIQYTNTTTYLACYKECQAFSGEPLLVDIWVHKSSNTENLGKAKFCL
jgi:hypothetical protein